MNEKIIPVEVHEVQPVIHRHREKTEIRQITQPYFQRVELEPQISHETLPSVTVSSE